MRTNWSADGLFWRQNSWVPSVGVDGRPSMTLKVLRYFENKKN